jgi:hypothetical protein
MVCDAILKRERRKLGGRDPPPEARLKAIWTGEILLPVSPLSHIPLSHSPPLQPTPYTFHLETPELTHCCR